MNATYIFELTFALALVAAAGYTIRSLVRRRDTPSARLAARYVEPTSGARAYEAIFRLLSHEDLQFLHRTPGGVQARRTLRLQRRRAVSLFLTQLREDFRSTSLRVREHAARTNDSELAMAVVRQTALFNVLMWAIQIQAWLAILGPVPAALSNPLLSRMQELRIAVVNQSLQIGAAS